MKLQLHLDTLQQILDLANKERALDSSLSSTVRITLQQECDSHLGNDKITVRLKSCYADADDKYLFDVFGDRYAAVPLLQQPITGRTYNNLLKWATHNAHRLAKKNPKEMTAADFLSAGLSIDSLKRVQSCGPKTIREISDCLKLDNLKLPAQ